jgi:hypothetical protein
MLSLACETRPATGELTEVVFAARPQRCPLQGTPLLGLRDCGAGFSRVLAANGVSSDRRYGIAAAHCICPSKPSDMAIAL